MEGCCHLTLVCLVVVVFSLSAHLPWVEPLCICILSDSNYSFESHFVPVCSLSCFHTSTQQWYQSQQRSLVQIFPSLSSTTVGISNPSSITKAFRGSALLLFPPSFSLFVHSWKYPLQTSLHLAPILCRSFFVCCRQQSFNQHHNLVAIPARSTPC